MTDYPGFGVLLTRLLGHRGTAVAELAARSGVAEAELSAVLGGAPPSDPVLRALAIALGFHAADLFVMADVPLPEDLLPLDGHGGADILRTVMALPRGQREIVHRLVAGLPQQERSPEAQPGGTPTGERRPRVVRQSAETLGAMLVSMLCVNRNLRTESRAARTIAVLTRGSMYLSPSTYRVIADGRAPLRPSWVVDLATTLGIDAGDLAAVTGVALPEDPRAADPLADEMAGLLWNLRRLSEDQMKQVTDAAEGMLVAVPDGASDREWNRVYHQGDIWWGAPCDPGE